MGQLRTKSILCVSHVAPWPASHGNEIRLQRLLLWFRRENYRLILVLTQPYFDPEQQDLIRAHVDRLEVASATHPLLQFRNRRDRLGWLLHSKWPSGNRRVKGASRGAMKEFSERLCPATVNTLVRRLAAEESIDIFLSYYAFTLQAFAGLSKKTRLICDTVEVFSITRHEENGEPIPPVLSFTTEEERLLLLQSDDLIAIQAVEAEYLRQLIPERNVLTVGIDCELSSDIGDPSDCEEVIGIIGSDNQANREGLEIFLTHSWPRIKAKRPQARLLIAGKLSNAHVEQHSHSQSDDVTALGWLPSLSDFYRELRFAVNPVRRGTGLKIKTVEALSHCRPVVTYPVGLEGIIWNVEPLPWRSVEDPDAMADACISLLADPNQCDNMAKTAKQFAHKNLSAEAVYAPLSTLIESRNRKYGLNSLFANNTWIKRLKVSSWLGQ